MREQTKVKEEIMRDNTDAQDENADMARKLRARGIKVLMVAARFSKR